MKDTVRNLYIAHEATSAFIQGNANIIIGKPGLAITYNYRILSDALSDYVKMRNDIIAKYGEHKEDGTVTLEPNTKNYENAMNEISQLEDTELEVFPILLSMDDLGTIANKVPMAQLVNLIWMTAKYQNGNDPTEGKERFTGGTKKNKPDESDFAPAEEVSVSQ